MIKVLILEDEEAAANRLQKMIVDILPDAEFIAHLTSVRQGLDWFKNNTEPDLIFADIQLNDGTSFDIFNQVEVKSPVIFTTAYDAYALDAFKLNSVDYLLKPVKKTDLSAAVEKFKTVHLSEKKDDNNNLKQLLNALQKTQNYKQRFVLRIGDHMKIIEVPDIAYFYTENKGNYIVTKDNKRFLADNNLDQIESMLDPKLFFRINRQFIVGFSSIAEMFTYSKSRVLLKLNPPAKLDTIVSTERSAAFKAWLGGD